MRTVLILLVIGAVAFVVMKRKSQKEHEQRLEEQERAADRLIRKRAQEADAQRAQAHQRLAVSASCDTAINNRQVLHDAMQRGGGVVSFGGGQAPQTPADMRAAFDEAQRFIEQNCAAAVEARRRPGGAYCSQPHMRGQLVCS